MWVGGGEKVVDEVTKVEYEREWGERIGKFNRLRINLSNKHRWELTDALAKLRTLVQLSTDRIFG